LELTGVFIMKIIFIPRTLAFIIENKTVEQKVPQIDELMHQHLHAPLATEELEGVPQPVVVLLEVLLAKLRVGLGLLLKDAGEWRVALEQFSTAVNLSPTYAEALREKGIAEDKLHYSAQADPASPTGEGSLLRAIAVNPDDFDAMASLGGVLKRQKRYEEALAMYRQATRASGGNPYPLLNELKLAAQLGKGVEFDAQRKFYIEGAERALRAQVCRRPSV
jgi:tetratricopeptide (TPR) repeat protein